MESRAEGLLEEAQEMVLEAIDERFGRVPKTLLNQQLQVKQP